MINCVCIGNNAGIDLTNENNMLCIKIVGFKEWRKQLTPEQMQTLKDIFCGEEFFYEKDNKAVKDFSQESVLL